jgi:putative transposase
MMSYSLNKLYAVVGISKQAVHGYAERQLAFMKAVEGLRLAVDAYLEDHGGCGLTKLYWTLQPAFLGRDRFIELFQSLGYGFKLKRSPKRTTYSGIFSYQNLIEGLLVTDINQVWQTDITYILAKDRYYYAVFIIDVYSKRILGYQVSNHMYTTANLKALKKSFKVRKASHFPNLIHHSDRGSQYGAKLYTEALSKANIHISMGRSAQENAYAERVNGIIKNEYLTFNSLATFNDVKRELNKAVKHYNNCRIHNHLPNRFSPLQFERYLQEQKSTDRPFIIIHAYDRLDYQEVKQNKLTTFNQMEKNFGELSAPLLTNPIFFNQNGQH